MFTLQLFCIKPLRLSWLISTLEEACPENISFRSTLMALYFQGPSFICLSFALFRRSYLQTARQRQRSHQQRPFRRRTFQLRFFCDAAAGNICLIYENTTHPRRLQITTNVSFSKSIAPIKNTQ